MHFPAFGFLKNPDSHSYYASNIPTMRVTFICKQKETQAYTKCIYKGKQGNIWELLNRISQKSCSANSTKVHDDFQSIKHITKQKKHITK